MARTNKVNAKNEGAFRHGTSIGESGELLFDAPIEIVDDADMKHYGITKEDCRYLRFNGSQKLRVFFYKTPSRELAEYQWETINNQHSSAYFASRCMVPGKRKAFVRCRDTNKCSACPYGVTPETRQAAVVSLDGLIESGWDPTPVESVEHTVLAKIEREEIRARMRAEDWRIAEAYEARTFLGDSVKTIATELGLSEPRVYQMLSRAKQIVKEYREENPNE